MSRYITITDEPTFVRSGSHFGAVVTVVANGGVSARFGSQADVAAGHGQVVAMDERASFELYEGCDEVWGVAESGDRADFIVEVLRGTADAPIVASDEDGDE